MELRLWDGNSGTAYCSHEGLTSQKTSPLAILSGYMSNLVALLELSQLPWESSALPLNGSKHGMMEGREAVFVSAFSGHVMNAKSRLKSIIIIILI